MADPTGPDQPTQDDTGRKAFTVTVTPGNPLSFAAFPENDFEQPGAEHARRIVRTLRRYRTSLLDLVATRYASVAESLPLHFRQPANIFIARCLDGVIVRYEACLEGKPWTKCGKIDASLEKMAPGFSDGFVYFPADLTTFEPGMNGPRVTMSKQDASGAVEDLFEIWPFVVATVPEPPTGQTGTARPMPIVSVTNEIELHIGGSILPAQTSKREICHSEEFVGRASGVMRVGWQAVEVYPALPPERWDEDLAPAWAETDLLAFLVQINATEASFARLDGRGETRRRYAALLAEFKSLLDGPEEPIHQFLKRCPELISPTSVRRWSKVPFGAHISDFVFLEPNNDYVLVEIEAAHRELFRADGQQRHELTHAVNQILDWVQHIEDHKSEVEEALPGISTRPRALVVIGRAGSLTDENRRKLTTISNQYGKLRILTYDDVLAAAKATLEQLLGPIDFESNMKLYFFNRTPFPPT